MDPTKARINEINFLEFCTRIMAIRNKMIDIKMILAHLTNYLEFDIEGLSKIVDIIFTPNMQVNISELYVLLDKGYITVKELEASYKKSKRTIYRYKVKGNQTVLYPRLNAENQLILDKFMTQYDKFFTRNYQNIFRIEGEN